MFGQIPVIGSGCGTWGCCGEPQNPGRLPSLHQSQKLHVQSHWTAGDEQPSLPATLQKHLRMSELIVQPLGGLQAGQVPAAAHFSSITVPATADALELG